MGLHSQSEGISGFLVWKPYSEDLSLKNQWSNSFILFYINQDAEDQKGKGANIGLFDS